MKAARLIRQRLGQRAAQFLVLDGHLWIRSPLPRGEARLSAVLRQTASGGGVELTVDRADVALVQRLAAVGFVVTRDDQEKLRATIGVGDFSRDADKLGEVAAEAMAAALGMIDTGGIAKLQLPTAVKLIAASQFSVLAANQFRVRPFVGQIKIEGSWYEVYGPISDKAGPLFGYIKADTRTLSYVSRGRAP